MKKVFCVENFSIAVESERKGRDWMIDYFKRCPFKIVVFDKGKEELKGVSFVDRINNTNELRRVYSSVTYLMFPIKFTEGQLLITNRSGFRHGMPLPDGVICISKRFIKTEFPEYMKAKQEQVKEFGYTMCKEFLKRHSQALLNWKCYDVTLLNGEETVENIESVFVSDSETLRTVLSENMNTSEPVFREIIKEISV